LQYLYIFIFILCKRIQSFFKVKIINYLFYFYRKKYFIRALVIFLNAFSIISILNFNLLTAIPENDRKSPVLQTQIDVHHLLEKGRKFYDDGNFSEAVIVLQQAATLFQSQGNKLEQAGTLTNLSLSFKQLGQQEAANNAITQSLKILQSEKKQGRKQQQILAQSLEIQAELQLQQGKAEAALLYWKQAEVNYQNIGDESGKIRSLINQTIAQQKLGFYRQARISLEEIYSQLEKQPDSLMKGTALRSFGDVLQLVGDLEKSRQILLQSINITQKLQLIEENSEALLSLGNTEHAFAHRIQTEPHLGNFEKNTPLSCANPKTQNQISTEALPFYQQAVQLYAEAANTSSSPITQIQAKVNQLNIFLELQQWSEIKKLLPNLQLQLTQISPSQSTIYATINFAQTLTCIKQATTIDFPTWKEIAQIVAKATQQAQNIGDKRSQTYAFGVLGWLYLETGDVSNARKLTEQALKRSQNIGATDITYLWQWQLGYILSLQDDIEGATALYTEAFNTLKSLRNDLVALNPDIQLSFRDNAEPVYRQLVDLLLQNKQSPVSQENLKQARDVIEALQLTELENFFREACLLAKPQQIDEVIDKTDTTAAVIYPIILKDRLEIILKLPKQNELRHYTTKKTGSEVEQILERLQQYLREIDRINEVKQLSSQVYSWLIEPLMTELEKSKIKTLVFVLDGSLRNIPMSALYDSKHQQYILEKYAISLTPGLQLLNPKPLAKGRIDALIAGVSETRNIEGRNFTSLKNVEDELKQIRTEIPHSQELLNQNFTTVNLKNKINSATFSVIHLATHGEFSSNVEKTFILTWEKLLKVRDFDNLLRVSNQDTSKKTIELLVLSACQTATGDKRATLGLAGVAIRAGARSTLATLWSVDDKSTAELMSKFYQELDNKTLTKAEALRRAQLAILSNYESPYFWAPYVLVGNWL
jgi:CHAT domain-containing protein